jgi:hypothetical protein
MSWGSMPNMAGPIAGFSPGGAQGLWGSIANGSNPMLSSSGPFMPWSYQPPGGGAYNVDQANQANAAMPSGLQIGGGTGQGAYNAGFQSYMNNTVNPALATQSSNAGASGMGNSTFAGAANGAIASAGGLNAQLAGLQAQTASVNNLATLRSSYLGVPTPGLNPSGGQGPGEAAFLQGQAGGGLQDQFQNQAQQSANGWGKANAIAGFGGALMGAL